MINLKELKEKWDKGLTPLYEITEYKGKNVKSFLSPRLKDAIIQVSIDYLAEQGVCFPSYNTISGEEYFITLKSLLETEKNGK